MWSNCRTYWYYLKATEFCLAIALWSILKMKFCKQSLRFEAFFHKGCITETYTFSQINATVYCRRNKVSCWRKVIFALHNNIKNILSRDGLVVKAYITNVSRNFKTTSCVICEKFFNMYYKKKKNLLRNVNFFRNWLAQ